MWKNIYIKSHQVWHFRFLIIHFECYFKHFKWQIYSHSSVCCMEFSLYLAIYTLQLDYTYRFIHYVLSRWLCDFVINIIKIFGYEQQNIVKHKYLWTKKGVFKKWWDVNLHLRSFWDWICYSHLSIQMEAIIWDALILT